MLTSRQFEHEGFPMRNAWLLPFVSLVGCTGRDERVGTTRATLSTPVVIRQETGYPAANGVVQGGPSWLGQCGATAFVVAGDIRTGSEPHRLVGDGGVELLRDLVPGPRFSLTGNDGFACLDGGALWIGGSGALGLGSSFLWRSDGTPLGTGPVRALSGSLRSWSGGLLLLQNSALLSIDGDGTTRQLGPGGEFVEGPNGALYVAASSLGSVWRTDGRTFDGGVSLGSPCGASTCVTSLRRTRHQLFIPSFSTTGTSNRNVSRLGDDGGLELVMTVANPASPSAADEFFVFVTLDGLSGTRDVWAIDDALDAGRRLSALSWTPQSLATRGRFAWIWEQRHELEAIDLLAPTPTNVAVTRADGGTLPNVHTVVSLPAGLLVHYDTGGLATVTGATAVDLIVPGVTPGVSALVGDGQAASFTRSQNFRTTLYRTDGSLMGTVPLGSYATTTDITQIDLLGNTPAGPSALVSSIGNSRLVRIAPDLTTQVVSASPSNLTGLPPFNFSVELDGGVAYSTAQGGNEISTWNGTDGGVRAAGSGALTRVGARAILRGQSTLSEVTIGATTTLLSDAGFLSFTGSGDELLTASIGASTQTLWAQGTGQGLSPVWTTTSIPQISAATRVDSRLVATGPARAPNGATIAALVSIDATGDAGTMALLPISAPAITNFYPLPTRHLAVALTGLGGGVGGVWVTNGFDAGLLWSGAIIRSVPTPTQVFFAGQQVDGGLQPTWWRTDGTAAGTIELTKAVAPVDAPLNIFTDGLQWVMRQPGDGPFFFAAGDELGNEPWISDGTVAGTARVADLTPGPGSSNPRNFIRNGDDLFFVATTPQGDAIWHLTLSGTPTGGGSSGTGGGASGTGGGASGTGGGARGTGGGSGGGGTAPGCSCGTTSFTPVVAALLLGLRRRRRESV